MDLPNLDPPPPPTITEPMPFAAASASHSAHVANPTPTQPSVHNHPPYAEMITAAIATLKERNGSSKKAIAKFIEAHYSNLPPTHSALLTHHLKRLKSSGQVLMVKHSYKLPRSAVASPVSPNGAMSDPAASVGPKKRPGRPPKPKSVQDALPVFVQPPNPMNAVPIVAPGEAQPENAAVETLGSVYVPVGPVTGRGRPIISGGAKRGPGRPPKSGVVQTGVGRGRGRPKKNAASPAARVKRLGRPRGRPPKVNNMEKGVAAVDDGVTGPLAVAVVPDGALASGGIVPAAVKRKGRPPKAGSEAKKPRMVATGEPKKPRNLSGKPLGRPKKNASAIASQTPDNQLLMAYLDLKGKFESFQSRIKQTVSIIKPYVNVESAVTALQELETLVTMDVSSSSNTQSQQPQLQQLQLQS